MAIFHLGCGRNFHPPALVVVVNKTKFILGAWNTICMNFEFIIPTVTLVVCTVTLAGDRAPHRALQGSGL